MDKLRYIYSLVTLFAMALLTSCLDESEEFSQHNRTGKLTVIATIGGSGNTTVTRAKLLSEVPEGGLGKGVNRDDYWSYWEFSKEDYDGDGRDDQVGFFSKNGNLETGGGFDNAIMTYETVKMGSSEYGVFTSDANVEFSKLSDKTTFFYFPYDENANADGIELRRKDTREKYGSDTLKCVDFLRMDGFSASGIETDGTMIGTFYHGFSELIIMRGEGFDKPKNDDYTIKVYLKQPYTHLQIKPEEKNGVWTCVPKLVNNQEGAKNGTAKNSSGNDDYHVWEAWHGHNYGITDEDKTGRPAWYVLLPTWGDGNDRTEVDYIEIADNEGTIQRVSALKLSNDKKSEKDPDNFTKKLTATWRYPFEISMQELVPTVTPYPIVPWDEEISITDNRECGINNLNDFEIWLAAYKAYLEDNRNETGSSKDEGDDDKNVNHIEELLRYGDRVVDADGKVLYWHFYLRADLDLSKYTNTPIDKLEDVLDGKSYTMVGSVFQNHTIKNLKQPFIGELSGQYATVQNFDFQEAELNVNGTDPIGVVAKKLTDGAKVDKCNVIKGSIITEGSVGMVAGTIEGGAKERKSTISNCNLSGFLIGTATHSNGKIVGTLTGDAVLDNNNATGVIFNEKN